MRPMLLFHRLVLPIDGLHEFFRFAEVVENRVEVIDSRVQPHQLFLGSVAVRTTGEVASDKDCSKGGCFCEFQVAL